MKRKTFLYLFLLVATLFLSKQSQAQQFVFYFDYDANGNRIERTWAKLEETKSSESLPFVVADSLQQALLTGTVIYPNPTRGMLTVSMPEIPAKGIQYQLYDQSGHVLERGTFYDSTTLLDISSRTDGVYFLLLVSENASTTYKIVKLL